MFLFVPVRLVDIWRRPVTGFFHVRLGAGKTGEEVEFVEETSMKRLRLFCIGVFGVALASCATGPDVPRMSEMLSEATGQNGRACVEVDDIQGYGVLENDVVSIDAFGGEYYLATVLPGCIDLQTSVRALFESDFFEICGQSGDSIVTGGDRCTIGQIYEFESRDEAFATFNSVLERREELRGTASY